MKQKAIKSRRVPRYNWSKIRRQFFNQELYSKFNDFWFATEGKKPTGTMFVKTKGWNEARLKFREKDAIETDEKIIKNMELMPLEQLLQNYSKLAQIVNAYITRKTTFSSDGKTVVKTKLKPKEMETLQKVMNRFLQRPESFKKQVNENINVNDILSEIKKGLPDVWQGEISEHENPTPALQN